MTLWACSSEESSVLAEDYEYKGEKTSGFHCQVSSSVRLQVEDALIASRTYTVISAEAKTMKHHNGGNEVLYLKSEISQGLCAQETPARPGNPFALRVEKQCDQIAAA